MWQRRADFETESSAERPVLHGGAIPARCTLSGWATRLLGGFGRRRLAFTSVLGLCTVLYGATAAASHEVQSGESLWSLSKRYGVSIEAIQRANGLSSEKIRQGQKLRIPGRESAKLQDKTKPPADETKSKSIRDERASKSSAPASKAPAATKPARAAASKAPAPATARQSSGAASGKRLAHSSDMALLSRFAPKPPPEPLPPGKQLLVSQRQQDEAFELYASDSLPAPSTLEEIAPPWVLERPAQASQGEKSNAARGGIYPCVAPDPGFGSYTKWVQVAPMAHVLAPNRISLDGASFDVVFHFHGREPIRKEWVKSMQNAVLVAVDIGIDSGAYADAYADARTFGSVIRAVEAEIARRSGNAEARVGRVALSSWSAGFGAIERILAQPLGQSLVDAVVLLDGLHSGYVGQSLDAERLAPFVTFAAAAARGNRLLFVSHSSIATTGYASTTETARYLTWKVGGRPSAVEAMAQDPMGLERFEAFSSGDFHVRGFKGSGAADHCAHLGLMRDVLRVHLLPRWQRAKPSEQPDALALGGQRHTGRAIAAP